MPHTKGKQGAAEIKPAMTLKNASCSFSVASTTSKSKFVSWPAVHERLATETASHRLKRSKWEGRLGHHIELQAMDGYQLGAHKADPDDQAIGGIVVLQEIFGVNHHIRSICDRQAGGGYDALLRHVTARPWPAISSEGGMV